MSLTDADTSQDSDDDDVDYKATRRTIRETSPFTALFNNAIADLNFDSEDVVERNDRCFPEGLDCVDSVVHLYPLWAAALHSNVQRFSYDSTSTAADLFIKPNSNAKIESYFGEMKTLVVSELRQRPSAFLRDVLINVKGRLNAAKLPPKQQRKRGQKRVEVGAIPETWRKKKPVKSRQSKYLVCTSAAKLLKLATDTFDDSELSNDDLDTLLLMLQATYPDIAGLEPPGLGVCVKGKSLPRFCRTKNTSRFVQIVNVGDHWVCLTNKFSQRDDEVFVFNSMASPSGVSQLVVLLSTSLLRRYDDDNANITFYVRNFQQQSQQTRLCGFYAAAAAIAICNGIDPTGLVFDEYVLQSEVRQRISNFSSTSRVNPISSLTQSTETKDIVVVNEPRLYCLCHGRDIGIAMTECSTCGNWFHNDCLPVKPPRAVQRRDSLQWLGPCCQREVLDTVDLTMSDDELRTKTRQVRSCLIHCCASYDVYKISNFYFMNELAVDLSGMQKLNRN